MKGSPTCREFRDAFPSNSVRCLDIFLTRVYLIRPSVPRRCSPEYVALSRCEWLMKLSSFFFCRAKTKNRGVSLAIFVIRETEIPVFLLSSRLPFLRLVLRFSTLRSLWSTRRTSADHFSLKRTHRWRSPRRLLSIALHTNDKLQISIRARRVRGRKRPTAQRVAGKLFASRCAQKANLRMRCAITLMPVRPAGPSLDFEQV